MQLSRNLLSCAEGLRAVSYTHLDVYKRQVLLILSLSACSLDFDGSRTGNDTQLIMEYTAFNTTDSQDLVVEAGDIIHAEIVVEDGHLSYKIQKDDDEPIACLLYTSRCV